MRLLIRVGLLGLHTAWALSGAVEAQSDSTAEKVPDGKPPPIAAAAAASAAAAEEGLADGDQQGRRRREEGEGRGGQENRRAPSESRALFNFPWISGGAKKSKSKSKSKPEPEIHLDTPMVSRLKDAAFGTNSTVAEGNPSDWKGAGGEFGLSADWREAISVADEGQGEGGGGGPHMSLRGEGCMTEEKRAEVWSILEKRRTAPSTKNVAVCVRTKDFGRFLPEWVAFHYVAGVDHISVYDDDSVDGTKEILRPFVEAGIVKYISGKIENRSRQMRPLNHCLDFHLKLRKRVGGDSSPRWLLFHDTDEYLYPMNTDSTILQALERHESICCLLVRRLQYGSGGHDEMPRGLLLEDFLMHNYPGGKHGNGNAKVIVNLDPTEPELGRIKVPLKSMHNGEGCECHGAESNGVPELNINHYLGSVGDYMDRTVRYWEDKRTGLMTPEKTALQRDTNYLRSDDVLHWACATREILYRIVEGLPLENEEPGTD